MSKGRWGEGTVVGATAQEKAEALAELLVMGREQYGQCAPCGCRTKGAADYIVCEDRAHNTVHICITCADDCGLFDREVRAHLKQFGWAVTTRFKGGREEAVGLELLADDIANDTYFGAREEAFLQVLAMRNPPRKKCKALGRSMPRGADMFQHPQIGLAALQELVAQEVDETLSIAWSEHVD